jgi:hypothetical protein
MIHRLPWLLLVILLLCPGAIQSQPVMPSGVLRGEVTDPSGAVVPGAQITLFSRGSRVDATQTHSDGRYAIRTIPGAYTVRVTAKGFAPLRVSRVLLADGKIKELNLPLAIAVQHQSVTVNAEMKSVGINPEQNSSSMVFKGKDLNALSDDPDELQSEIQQLANATAGPNGGQVYIDGFAGGRLPPKSSILEIRVNQNPFSASFDRIGYGRIDIITKPGTQTLHGTLSAYGNNSAVNSSNPIVAKLPDYYMYSYSGDIEGPLGKHATFLLSGFKMAKQNQSVVDALNPQDTTAKLSQAVPNPSSVIVGNPRVDVQIGNHTLSFRDYFYKSTVSGANVGGLYLADQGLNTDYVGNTVQLSDVYLASPHLINELHLEWRRERTTQAAVSSAPEIVVSGAFVAGGNIAGTVRDHQNVASMRDETTLTAGNHTLRFGGRMDAYWDSNYSTAGSNGVYTYSSIAAYQASSPSQISFTTINNPLVRVFVVDGALFLQDDWRIKSNLMLGIGLRYEAQNKFRDRKDWAPRLALAWSPGRPSSETAKTVIRAGYGWFYDRFTVPTGFTAFGNAPYVVQVEHDNRINQQTYVINNPGSPLSTAIPSYHSLDPQFRAALNMQAGLGVDRQFARGFTANLTYLFTQGIHQYYSNNVTAPSFNIDSYSVTGATPSVYNYQFQSGGFFKQHQIVATANVQTHALMLNGSYSFNVAHSNTQGANSFVSVATNPGFDYGRATFTARHRATVMQSYTAPYGFVIASLFTVQSGFPFNITIVNDLTGNNQFNARPAYGTCGGTGVVATRYGCLDTNPAGKNERIVPFGAGMGPSNLLLDLRLSKTFGIGPRIKTETGGNTFEGDSDMGDRGFTGNTSAIRLNASAPRRGSLTFVIGASNVLNKVNWGPPNGVLFSPMFNQSQSLADGAFANPTPGNRAFIFQTSFSF